MCGCGRKRTEAPTSVQAAEEAQAILRQAEERAITEAETYLRSASNAARNASSK